MLFVLTFVAGPALAQEPITFRESTGGHQIISSVIESPLPHGLLVTSSLSNGDFYEVEYGPANGTVRYSVVSPARKLDYTARREGNIIGFEGTFGGKPLSRKQRIDDRPWLETVEISLVPFMLSASRTPILFWIVAPWEARAYLMQATNEGAETVSVDTAQIPAMRVRVKPTGLLAALWSSLYWYRASDGRFVKYEAFRGMPGTPLTVVELVPP